MKLIEKIKEIIYKVKDYDRLESDYCTCLCYFTKDRMSKPNYQIETVKEVISDSISEYIQEGYEAAIEDACKWFDEHWRDYVWLTDDNIIHFGLWKNDFKKALEEE